MSYFQEICLSALCSILVTIPVFAQPPGSGWILDFEDNFGGPNGNVNTGIWRDLLYDEYDPKHTNVRNGNLVITGEAFNQNGQVVTKGGRVDTWTKRTFRFGYFETRCRLSYKARNVWPAVWLGDGASDTELDIFEWLHENNDDGLGPNQSHHFQNTSNIIVKLPNSFNPAQWHKYAALWTPTEISFYVDGNFQYSSPRNEVDDIYFLVTMSPDINLQHSAGDSYPEFLVDYVRAWKRNSYNGYSGPKKARIAIPGTLQAENFTIPSGIQTIAANDTGGGLGVGFLDNGDWMDYQVNIATAGDYTIRYRAASNSSGNIRLLVDGVNKGTKFINNTGGWQNWQNFNATVNLPAGNHTIRLQCTSGSWNLNKVDFTSTGGNPPTGVPIGQIISLQGNNNLYASSENGIGTMNCNRPSAAAWEKFTVVSAGGGKIALRGSNGKYVSSENGSGGITCNRSTIGAWEKFDWVAQSSNSVALKGSNGRYISSENGTINMTCSRTTVGNWEKFNWAISGARQGNDVEKGQSIAIFPNPTNGVLNIANLPDGEYEISLFDLSGTAVLRELIDPANGSQLSMSGVSAGIYLVVIIGNGINEKLKVTIQ